MHYGVKQEGRPAFRQIYAMKKILQKGIVRKAAN